VKNIHKKNGKGRVPKKVIALFLRKNNVPTRVDVSEVYT